jgi:hypothetical protein
VRLADFLADGNHDPPPADHRADPQRQRHAQLDPEGDVLDWLAEVFAQGLQKLAGLFGEPNRPLGLLQTGEILLEPQQPGSELQALFAGQFLEAADGLAVPEQQLLHSG